MACQAVAQQQPCLVNSDEEPAAVLEAVSFPLTARSEMGHLGSSFPGDGAGDKTQPGVRMHVGVKSGSQQENEPFLNRFAVRVFKNRARSVFTPRDHCPGYCVTRQARAFELCFI